MRFVALFSYGPAWNHDRSVFGQGQPMSDHLVSMRRRYDEGSLLLGGPFDTAGGIAVLDVADRQAAIEFLEADPAVVAGVLDYTLHELTAYFDAYNSTRTDSTITDLARQRRIGR